MCESPSSGRFKSRCPLVSARKRVSIWLSGTRRNTCRESPRSPSRFSDTSMIASLSIALCASPPLLTSRCNVSHAELIPSRGPQRRRLTCALWAVYHQLRLPQGPGKERLRPCGCARRVYVCFHVLSSTTGIRNDAVPCCLST